MEITGVQQWESWRRKALPPVEEVRPGLWSIPVPIPDNPLRYILVYAFAHPDGLTLIDAGWESDEGWDALVAGLDQAGYRPEDIHTVLLTHMHPDHVGLAQRIRSVSGARIGMHCDDTVLLQHTTPEASTSSRGSAAAQLEWMGAPTAVARSQRDSSPHRFPASSGPELAIEDGDRIDLPGWALQAIWTPGHTPGHLCFYERTHGILFSGDHVLPRISPNISFVPGQLPNPLGTYLDSLRSIAEWVPTEVCPAHEYRFRALGERVGAMLSHHADRMAEIEKVVIDHQGSTGWEVASRLVWSRPFAGMDDLPASLAVRETLAHLVLLESWGRLRSSGDPVALWYPNTGKQ